MRPGPYSRRGAMTLDSRPHRLKPNAILYFSLGLSLALIVLGAFISPGPLASLLRIWSDPALLLTDFSYVGSVGGAMLNAGLMGIMATALAVSSGEFQGMRFSAVMMCIGFAFFGKTPLAGGIIIAGTVLRGLAGGRNPMEYIVVGLFGTCLSPMVSFLAHSTAAGWLAAVPAGLAAGFILPDVSALTKRAYKNMNLYNVGFAAAVVAAVAADLIKGLGIRLEQSVNPTVSYPGWAYIALGALYALTGILALLFISGSWDGFKSIGKCKCDGADFISTGGVGGVLVNFSLSGLLCIALTGILLRAPLNGPLLGTIISVTGFSAAAMKPSSMLTLMAGYVAAFFASSYGLSTAVAMGSLFVTGLSPLSDKLGPMYGFAAGFLHLFVVSKCSSLHSGLMLYNNGLSAGLVAIMVVAAYTALNPAAKTDL